MDRRPRKQAQGRERSTRKRPLFPDPDADGRLVNFVAIKLDVTREKELEAQLRQSQKMEAVGRLAGGVAHDFNNMLTVITGYSEFLLKRLSASDPIRSGAPRPSGRRGSGRRGLTRQLLAFSRKQILAPQVLNVNRVVSETDKMLRRLIGEDIELVAILAPDLGNVKADPGQIEQVVMNLAVNARDAMPEGGGSRSRRRTSISPEEYAREHIDASPGPHVMLAVSDTGVGMDEETRSHIFEPFFTTKEWARGRAWGFPRCMGSSNRAMDLSTPRACRNGERRSRFSCPDRGDGRSLSREERA